MPSSPVVIEVVSDVRGERGEELLAAFARLLPQLAPDAPVPTAPQLSAMVASHGTTLVVARDDGTGGRIVGMLALVQGQLPTGARATIEDVVVDSAARGRGIGEALVREALHLAHSGGAQHVDLTSRPSREEANRLYERLGFSRRETNVYRYDLTPRDVE